MVPTCPITRSLPGSSTVTCRSLATLLEMGLRAALDIFLGYTVHAISRRGSPYWHTLISHRFVLWHSESAMFCVPEFFCRQTQAAKPSQRSLSEIDDADAPRELVVAFYSKTSHTPSISRHDNDDPLSSSTRRRTWGSLSPDYSHSCDSPIPRSGA